MNITQNITLDLAKRSVFQYVSAKQGDDSSRLVRITLTNNGEIYQVPKGVGANFRAQKPDGTMILNPAVVNDDGTVTIELTQQTLAVSGDVIADIFLTDVEGGILSSVSFVIHVEAAPDGMKTDSTSEFLVFTQMVERAEAAAMKAEQFVENAADKSFVENLVAAEREKIDRIGGRDYIVSQGISGMWRYRKWNSGIAECWGYKLVANINTSDLWGTGIYRSTVTTTAGAYPFPFVRSPSEILSVNDVNADRAYLVFTDRGNTQQESGGYTFGTPFSQAGSGSISLNYHVLGEWK